MFKIIVDKYYLILIFIVILTVFNVLFRDPIINSIFNINPNQSVTDAENYANSVRLRDVFIYAMWGGLFFAGLISITFLFVPRGKELNKSILLAVPIVVAILFFCVMVIGGFS